MNKHKEWIEAGFWIGRQQAFAVVANHSSAAQAVCLKEIRDSRAFEKFGLPELTLPHALHTSR